MLPFYTTVATLGIIFLVMTAIRIWFDLAQVDVVVRDQRAVRKSVAAGWRYTRRFFIRLLSTYTTIAFVGGLILVGGLWIWERLVPPASLFLAFLVSQILLFLLLGIRFWQRASAAAFYLREMGVAVPAFQPAVTSPDPPAALPVAPEPSGGTGSA